MIIEIDISFISSHFESGNKKNSAFILFMWAILFNRVEIAKIFLLQAEVCEK